MLKSLSVPLVIVLSGALSVVSSQIKITQSESLSSVNHAGSGNVPRNVSPEASAEAKRLYKEGVKYGLAGLYAQAAEIFQRTLKLDPQHADAYYGLGHAYFDMRQWDKAILNLQQAVKLNPRDQAAHDRLEQARLMLEREGDHKTVPARSETSPPAGAEQVSMNVKPGSLPVKTKNPPLDEANPSSNDMALVKIYRVGPGDVLDVRVNEAASQQSTLFTITPSGLLEHPVLPEALNVSGLTIEEISAKFEGELKRRALMDNPKVQVGVRDYVSHTILVSGLVKDSGTKILRREAIPLYVVVADAQPLPEASRASIVRNESNRTYEIDLAQPADMNLLIRPGDVITLHANVTQFVYVGGEVKLPGEKTYRRGLTLTQAMIAAGGVTRKSKEARIGRDDGRGFLVVTRFKLKDIESGKVPDPLVRPGDRIMILD
jgi:polysaccharide biosynthesis/export protein